jgi:diamine N-acetyltransferase
MASETSAGSEARVLLRPVDGDNWRDVAKLKVAASQRDFVAEPCYYLTLCCYGDDWRPLAICLDEQVIGFMMWTTDPADGSCWLGGILIDERWQNRGYGTLAVRAAIEMLSAEGGYTDFALSYQPANLVAKHLYSKLGFMETDEWEGDEIVARLSLAE